ncbi:MAG: M13 family metallopeptidase [Anaeromyxobacteraceae bacterium]
MTLVLPILAVLQAATPAAGQAIDPANLDPAVPACQDFYHHAVGGWQKANPIPADKARYGAFEELAERNRAILKTILEETSAKKDWKKGSIQQKVGDFFASGMDEDAIEKAGAKPLQPWLARIDKVKSADDLPAYLAEASLAGVPGGIGLGVGQDDKDSTRYVPTLWQGGLGLPDRDYYLKDDDRSKGLREKYATFVSTLFVLLGEKEGQAREDAAAVIALETKLAQAARTRVALRDPEANYNKRTLAELEQEAPGYGWATFLGKQGIPKAQDLVVGQPEFAKAFAALTRSEPIATWRTYLRFHAARGAAPYLSKAFDQASFEFYGKALNGVQQQEPRWKRVQGVVDRNLGEALGQLYVEKAFGPAQKERMKTLVENLRKALSERIAGLAWMSPETKAAAQKKLAAFGVKIGYPDRWRDYSKLDVKRAGYLDNVQAASTFESKREIAKLGKPIDRTEWGMSPPTVNAYYSPNMNEIVFPAGILQPPFFWPDADDAVNYGGIGVVIGHEMTHGFDDQGAQFDAEGNLKNWWTDADKKAYEGRTGLVVKQFDAFKPFPDASVNGKLTLGENIADLGGLKIAWAALEKALGKDPNQAPKVGDLTPGQRFFLSYANVWRNNIRDEALRVRLATDVHSPGQYRVLGPVANLPEFYTAFGCKDGDAMKRPEAERPAIW